MTKIFSSIKDALKDVKAGKMLVITDDKARENEGDLFCASEKITPKIINFMAKYGRGLICAPMSKERLQRLNIGDMVANPTEKKGCRFTVSVDYRKGTTTGISAFDRALTVKKLIDETSKPEDFARPGHIFPLAAVENGVFARAGHTEAAVDMAALAGFKPAGVICEIMREDGKMARLPELKKFAKKHKLKIISVEDLILYRKSRKSRVQENASVDFPTRYGDFKLKLFENESNKEAALALIKGSVKDKKNVFARVHSSCETGDVFHSLKCDCGAQLELALEKIEAKGEGLLIYMHQEGRGIGLANKIKAYQLQQRGMDTVEANIALGFAPDLRDYAMAAGIFDALGVKSVKLLTNNPDKIENLKSYGIKVSGRISLEIPPVKSNRRYLKTKKDKMRHLLELK